MDNVINKISFKLFIAFLKKKKWLNNFIINYNSFQGQWFRNNAFSSERAQEGFSYYAKLDEELREYYLNWISNNIFNSIRQCINGKK